MKKVGVYTHCEPSQREETQISLLSRLIPGDVVQGTVCGVDDENVYVDLGGSVSAVLPAERIAVPPCACDTGLFETRQVIYAAVRRIDRRERRVYLTHRELLGTFEELTAGLKPGDALAGRLYGGIVLFGSNLYAQAVNPRGEDDGKDIIVRVEDIRRAQCEVDVHITGVYDGPNRPLFTYYITQGRIKHWNYSRFPIQISCGESVFAF